jgi:hypothetical protein
MSAVLVSLPTARPSYADDSEERTQFFRPSQKRPTWRDVERERARSSTPADTRTSSQLAPVLRLAPKPETRGSSRPAAHVPPYLRKGYWNRDWLSPSAPLGEKCHAAMRAEMGRAAAIRPTPKNLAALLRTPEWNGAKIVGTVPSPEVGPAETALAAASARLEEAAREIASLDERIASATSENVRETLAASRRSMWAARTQRAKSTEEARQRLEMVRAEEWIHVVHPSGAELKMRPDRT